jgi:hypothetical protein
MLKAEQLLMTHVTRIAVQAKLRMFERPR